MTKYLFLDVDGVLNNYGWFEQQRAAYGMAARNNMTDLERAQIDWDPANVAQLERIVLAQPELQIVISSTWRRLYNLAEIRGFIQKAGGAEACQRVIGKTGYRPELWKIRGQEIDQWLADYHDEENTPPYVILDDDNDMLPKQKDRHFVHTNYMVGLTEDNADLAIKILG